MKHYTLDNPRYQSLHKAFEKRKQDEGKSHSHIESVSNLSKEFLRYLEHQNINDIKTVDQTIIDRYFLYLQHRKHQRREGLLSGAYLQKHREAVLRLLEFAYNLNIGQAPFFIPKFDSNNIPKDILTEEEVSQLFQQTDATMDGIRNKVLLSLLYGCGLRKAEVHQLNIHDVDLAKGIIRIQHSKTATQRDVPMTHQIQQNVETYLFGAREFLLPEHTTEEAFLLNNEGKRLSLHGIQYKIKTLGERSGISKPITCHRLRHAIATHLLGDFTIEEIALFLGHHSLDSTQIYTQMKYTQIPKSL